MPNSTGSLRFYRRPDLSLTHRLDIVYSALCQRSWGNITFLSKKFGISRTFIYQLIDKLTLALDVETPIVNVSSVSPHIQSLRSILKLRLEGCCSIGAIHSLSQHFDLPFHSVGFISQTLEQLGTSLGNKLDHQSPMAIKVVVNSDEIFYKSHPILITVEPNSLSILQIDIAPDHKAETWKAHWSGIMENFEFSQITKDQGSGMSSAHSQFFPGTPCQNDTFHAVAHQLGLFKSRFLKMAYAAIEEEYEQERMFYTAKSEQTLHKRFENWVTAQKKAVRATQLFDHFSWLYAELLSCFDVFDKKGQLNSKATAEQTFEVALQLLQQLNNNSINEKLQKIRKSTDNLFHYLIIANQVVGELKQKIHEQVLTPLCVAWQMAKKAIKSKDAKKKNYWKEKEEESIKEARFLLSSWMQEAQCEKMIQEVFSELDKINQSSAAVECINSILRSYLNTCKNQPSKAMLNLFMFYHNHRRFCAGKRKGKTPFEILTGKTQDKDWVDLLLEKAA
jgi:hypothetical protein